MLFNLIETSRQIHIFGSVYYEYKHRHPGFKYHLLSLNRVIFVSTLK